MCVCVCVCVCFCVVWCFCFVPFCFEGKRGGLVGCLEFALLLERLRTFGWCRFRGLGFGVPLPLDVGLRAEGLRLRA